MNDITNLYSPHAEESLVGAALINPEIISQVDAQAGDFYISKNGMIWDVLESLNKRGINPDYVTVCDELENRKQLSDVGGHAYIGGLISGTPSSMGAQDYARIVKDLAARRHTIRVASDLVNLAMNQEKELTQSISEIMTELNKSASVNRGAVHWSRYLGQAYDLIEERAKNPQDNWGIPTGFIDYDRITGGLQSTEIMLLSGEPGKGKSIIALQMAEQMAAAGHPGALYSLEMLGQAVTLRALSTKAKIESRKLKSGRVGDDQWAQLIAAFESLSDLPIYMSDAVDWTTAGLRADLSRLKKLHKIEWFIIDYSYLVQDGMGKLNEIERTQVVIANLKAIAKTLGLAGVIIHSMTKAGMQAATASQTNLRGSGQVTYDADVILFLMDHQPGQGQPSPNMITCVFGKGRELDDPRRFFHLVKLPGFPAFGNYTGSPMKP
jgi:replicative DNA helicase